MIYGEAIRNDEPAHSGDIWRCSSPQKRFRSPSNSRGVRRELCRRLPGHKTECIVRRRTDSK
jgi:hypothetical protein